MAVELGISPASVQRIWRRNGLKPHLVRTFKVSNDPNFVQKPEDIVGLYLNPPENALVFSVDEKSQIQRSTVRSRVCRSRRDVQER